MKKYPSIVDGSTDFFPPQMEDSIFMRCRNFHQCKPDIWRERG